MNKRKEKRAVPVGMVRVTGGSRGAGVVEAGHTGGLAVGMVEGSRQQDLAQLRKQMVEVCFNSKP